MFKGNWAKLRPKLCLLRQSWTKYLEQNREIELNWTGKTGQGKKSLISTYLIRLVFDCYYQGLISRRDTGH